MNVQIIGVSSKGQIVLPSGMRKKLGIASGDKLLAYCGEDCVILKTMKLPSEEEFEDGIRKNMKIAQETGLTEEDIFEAIKESRKKDK